MITWEGGTSSLTLFDRPNPMLSDFTEVEYAAWFELYLTTKIAL